MSNFIDLTGRKFGRLTVLGLQGRNKHGQLMWKCKCDCGNEVVLRGYSIRYHHVSSCGCKRKEVAKEKAYKHGGCGDRLYRIWGDMKSRTVQKSGKDWRNYTSRGITVCNDWKRDYLVFKKWALDNGYNDDLTIDRIDVNKGYTPENCRWVTPKQQANNRRTNVYITYNGMTKTLSEWSDYTGLSYSCLSDRRLRGYTADKMFVPLLKEKRG